MTKALLIVGALFWGFVLAVVMALTLALFEGARAFLSPTVWFLAIVIAWVRARDPFPYSYAALISIGLFAALVFVDRVFIDVPVGGMGSTGPPIVAGFARLPAALIIFSFVHLGYFGIRRWILRDTRRARSWHQGGDQ